MRRFIKIWLLFSVIGFVSEILFSFWKEQVFSLRIGLFIEPLVFGLFLTVLVTKLLPNWSINNQRQFFAKLWQKRKEGIIQKEIVIKDTLDNIKSKIKSILEELNIKYVSDIKNNQILGMIRFGRGLFKKVPTQYIKVIFQSSNNGVIIKIEVIEYLCFSTNADRDTKINDLVGEITSRL